MDEIKIKDEFRYIVATMDAIPMFLIRDNNYKRTLKFALSDNVSRALKATDYDAAREMLKCYKADSKDDRAFTIMKLRVSYELV